MNQPAGPETAAMTRGVAAVPDSLLELTVIAPTLNERDNIEPFLAAVAAALEGVAWEVIFVDDNSSDGTAALVRDIARRDRRVRCLQRVGRRGLSSACVEGVLASAAPFVAVMDADMQHDERLLPGMLAALRDGTLDIVVGSRYVAGGGVGGWDSQRQTISRVATRLSRIVVRSDVQDPMSGFFMVRREAFAAALPRLSQQGFKILVDLFASSPSPLRYRELAYQFRERRFGESKLDSLVAWEYLLLLLDKTVGRFVPVRFLMFTGVGALGASVHFGVLWLALFAAGRSFEFAQSAATACAMVFNFTINNVFTYRDQRLRGWRFLRGLATFVLVCSIGAVANVGVGSYVFRENQTWWIGGLSGALVSAVWNYAASAAYTWRKR